MASLCYEVTGPSGEPDIGLEVAVGGGAPIRVAGSVGRGSADVDLGATGYDPQDLHVQLFVDGTRLDGSRGDDPRGPRRARRRRPGLSLTGYEAGVAPGMLRVVMSARG